MVLISWLEEALAVLMTNYLASNPSTYASSTTTVHGPHVLLQIAKITYKMKSIPIITSKYSTLVPLNV